MRAAALARLSDYKAFCWSDDVVWYSCRHAEQTLAPMHAVNSILKPLTELTGNKSIIYDDLVIKSIKFGPQFLLDKTYALSTFFKFYYLARSNLLQGNQFYYIYITRVIE